MTTKVKPTVDKWVESIKQTCFDCIDYDGETVTWQSVLDKYLTEIVSEIKSHSVQEAKAESKLEHGLEALERYFYMVKMPDSKVNFWREWYKTCLSLEASLKQEENKV